jgi:hypothetical protein
VVLVDFKKRTGTQFLLVKIDYDNQYRNGWRNGLGAKEEGPSSIIDYEEKG